jgi:hypothetical protein
LTFLTINDAPFDALTDCVSVPWHLDVCEGDWRVPAHRYRDWFEANCRPQRLEVRQPSWAGTIRTCVIMGLDPEILEALAKRLDPQQTLLYLPDWRTAGYDRGYPDYDSPVPQLAPFLRRAHQLGFRAMLHVNYFGVDPLHALYKRFESYQVRDAWGTHEKQWWVWPPEKPDIRFAYINPACKAWREHFVAAMVRLRRRTEIDALHLDQTLCIYNDHQGRLGGLSMLEGSLALHRELREALPEVALSGEGLNEVTCRYEAFAQRHVWGMDHVNGRWDRYWLAAAHPISSYVLRPYTTMYGYLGCAPPESDQLYAAWSEAYRHWGVIPTLKPALASVIHPQGFARQFFDEAAFWQGEGLRINLEGPWPADVAFPYQTAAGRRVTATLDRRLMCGDREISRTITGAGQVAGLGTIPDWRGFDQDHLLGLDPERWYPCFQEPRDRKAFHVSRFPDRLTLAAVVELGDIAMVEARDSISVVADLTVSLNGAICGTRTAAEKPIEVQGPMEAADGGSFTASGDTIAAHPPWKVAGSGESYARFPITLPTDGTLRFVSEVALDPGAVGPGRSDGVTFSVRAFDGPRSLSQQLDTAIAEPRALELDLSPWSGRRITLELAVGPGPQGSPSFDWARWRRPRVEQVIRGDQTLGVSGGRKWEIALGTAGPAPIRRDGDVQEVRVPLPGTVYFLHEVPALVRLPLDLSGSAYRQVLVSDSGQVISSAQHAGINRQASVVGGLRREGLFAHPPDHGRTIGLFPITLPSVPAKLETWIGIRDQSTSDGVIFIVQVNGRELARRKMIPGRWERLSLDLGPWAGKSAVLALITDSDGPYTCDWAAWGEPQILAKE